MHRYLAIPEWQLAPDRRLLAQLDVPGAKSPSRFDRSFDERELGSGFVGAYASVARLRERDEKISEQEASLVHKREDPADRSSLVFGQPRIMTVRKRRLQNLPPPGCVVESRLRGAGDVLVPRALIAKLVRSDSHTPRPMASLNAEPQLTFIYGWSASTHRTASATRSTS